jgi:hypothetical protein
MTQKFLYQLHLVSRICFILLFLHFAFFINLKEPSHVGEQKHAMIAQCSQISQYSSKIFLGEVEWPIIANDGEIGTPLLSLARNDLLPEPPQVGMFEYGKFALMKGSIDARLRIGMT